MKRFWAFMAILLAFTLTAEVAHAKRFGGGKSFGRSYQTAPSQPSKSYADSTTQRKQTAGMPASNGRRGLMGGLLGGLLAGGLIAALFGMGAFDGIQLMDILIIAVIGFVLFKLFRSMSQRQAPVMTRQPAYAGASAGGQAAPQQPVFGSGQRDNFGSSGAAVATMASSTPDVPFNLPVGFDAPSFLQGAKEHYRILQDAWNKNDLGKIQEYVTPELYKELQAERASLTGEQHTEVLSVEAELVRADQMFGNAEISIKFTGRYRDVVEGVEEPFTDIWHLERDFSKTEAPWLVTGIQS